VHVRQIRVTEGDKICSFRNWFDVTVELAINEKDAERETSYGSYMYGNG
jgi:hypothetical protein